MSLPGGKELLQKLWPRVSAPDLTTALKSGDACGLAPDGHHFCTRMSCLCAHPGSFQNPALKPRLSVHTQAALVDFLRVLLISNSKTESCLHKESEGYLLSGECRDFNPSTFLYKTEPEITIVPKTFIFKNKCH